jgi:predicted nucleic acid binding AN1-type Zn finger protein
MPCQKCKKKCGVPMDCNYCNGQFCIKCFRLEVHDCPGQEEKIKKDRENLIKKLEYDPEPKHLKI